MSGSGHIWTEMMMLNGRMFVIESAGTSKDNLLRTSFNIN